MQTDLSFFKKHFLEIKKSTTATSSSSRNAAAEPETQFGSLGCRTP